MSVGVLMGRKPITGSCGGVGAALGEKDYKCDLCGGDPKKCDEQQLKASGATDTQPKEQLQQLAETLDDLSYDATRSTRRKNK